MNVSHRVGLLGRNDCGGTQKAAPNFWLLLPLGGGLDKIDLVAAGADCCNSDKKESIPVSLP